MKLTAILPILLLSGFAQASGGFASNGKDLNCDIQLEAFSKPFTCDYQPGGFCQDLVASNLVNFKVLKGDLSLGLSGTVLPISFKPYVNNTDSEAIQNELMQLGRKLNFRLAVSYENYTLTMALSSSKKSQTTNSKVDMSKGKKYARDVMIIKNLGTVGDGLTVDATLTCAASTKADGF